MSKKGRYCICGNLYENCTCVKCDICRKDFPQTEIYYKNNLNMCEKCKFKRDVDSSKMEQAKGGE
jgi:hypothetical protein